MESDYINKTTDLVILQRQDLTNGAAKVKPKSMPKYWDREYIHQNINQTKNYRHKMLLQFLWMTGVRVTEAINLRKQDIDFENCTLLIRWQKSRKWENRNIPLHPLLKDLIQLYTANLNADNLVFPITRQRAWQIVKKCLGGHPHQFRHSFAVNWLRCGGGYSDTLQDVGSFQNSNNYGIFENSSC